MCSSDLQTQTLDLFYEASQAYPIRLDKVNAESYIKHGSKVAPIVGGDLNDLVNGGFKVVNVKGAEAIQGNYAYFNSNSSEDYFCIVTIANEAGQNVQDYFLELGLDFIQTNTVFSSGSYIRFEQEDGSYVTAQAVSMNTVDNTIKIIPYTHSTQQGFIGSNISVGETDICLPWYNCFAFGNGVESDRIRDDFNSKTIFPYTSVGKQSGFKASLPVVNYNKREITRDIIFSQIFNESTQVAGYNEFIVAEDITKKLNSEYGSIQRLYTRQSNVLAFCENKVLKILADKDALFNADGEILRVSSTNVLGEAVPFSGDHGISNNTESLAVGAYRIYFTDKFRGYVGRLSQDGGR